ncbi:MAG TPA: transglutaminase-like domain-containing protein [Planctomycetota bacterium]|nr:transglutaminase-like domain-containing protein [Planctomycetota bacterium]
MRPVRVRSLSISVPVLFFVACHSADAGSAGGSTGGPEAAYARMPANPDYLKPGDSRTFAIQYTAQVKDIPAGTKQLRLWVPIPQDSPVQTIRDLKFAGSAPRLTTEKKFGNRIAYWEIADPTASVETTYSFTCTRREQITDLSRVAPEGSETQAVPAVFTGNDKLTFVDDRIRTMAREITAGKTTTVEKARAIYDYVLGHMKYDKSGEGWGRGDTNYACDVGKGNCTDFHALFMSLARASNIPAGFEIGLYLPYEVGKQETPGGYHCWSFFRAPGKTWVPIDASEAGRNPARADYFFGAHTSNRVTLSAGRDLVLEPPQAGAPVNYLLNPYAEADGKPVSTSKTWTYHDQ